MSTLGHAVYRRLVSATAVSAIVSTRIRPMRLGQEDTLPAITFQRISTTPQHAMVSTPSLRVSRVQVRGYATTATGAVALAGVVRTRMDRWRGTTTGVVIQDALLANEFDFEDTSFGADRVVYGVHQDFNIWHEEG